MNRAGVRLLAALLITAFGARAEEVQRFYGYAHFVDGGGYAFTEVQDQRLRNGQWSSGTTAYYLPDGHRFAFKTLDFEGDEFVPLTQLETSDGYAEGISANGDPIELFHGRSAKPARDTVEREGLMTADAGLPRLLRARLPELLAGETLRFRLVAPSRLSSYAFRARRGPDTTFEGRPAVRIRVEMDSLFKLFAGPLTFTFDPETRKLLEFSGLTNVPNPAAGKPFVVRISYGARPADAPASLPPLLPPEH